MRRPTFPAYAPSHAHEKSPSGSDMPNHRPRRATRVRTAIRSNRFRSLLQCYIKPQQED
jgi:hypothetical protein